MLEQETEAILATLSARTIGDRETILLGEVLAADVPRGIKTYMQAETVRQLEAELFASPRFARVDRQAGEVRRLGRAFIASMAAHYRFPKEEYNALLENAIHFLENYLCRPQWTIQNFVFESGTQMDTQEVVAKLDCTVDYAYFRTLIQKVLNRRGRSEINAEEFRSMLVRIDDQIVKQHNARELALLAKPIFDFLLLRDTPPDVSIPLKPILVFFEDKKMSILRDYIESICRIRQRSEITLDELTTLVEDLYLGQTTPAAPASGAQVVPTDGPADSEPGPAGENPPGEAREAGDERPLLPVEEFGGYEPTIEIPASSVLDFFTEEPDGSDDGPLPEEPPQAGTTRVPSPGEIPPLQTPERAQERPPEKPAPRQSYERLFDLPEPGKDLTDIRELIGGHTRSRFVKRLFDRDEERYEDVITSLNNSATWKDASHILNSLYLTRGLDPFDPDVVEFTDAIHRRYLDAGKDD